MCIPVRKLFTTHIITWDTPCITGYYWDVVWLPSSLQQTNIAIEFSTIDNDIPTKTEYIFSLVFCMICMFTSGYYPLTHCDAAEPAVRSLWWRVAHGATCNPSWHWRGGWPRSWDGWPLGSKMGSFSMFQQQLCVVYLWCNLRCHCFLFWDRPLELAVERLEDGWGFDEYEDFEEENAGSMGCLRCLTPRAKAGFGCWEKEQ